SSTHPHLFVASDTARTGRSPLSLHDALPICLFLRHERRLYAYILTLLPHRADADDALQEASLAMWDKFDAAAPPDDFLAWARRRSEEHTSELQSQSNLVCRLLLEKKNIEEHT